MVSVLIVRTSQWHVRWDWVGGWEHAHEMAADRHTVSAKESESCAKGEPGDSRTYSSYSMVKDIVFVTSSFGWSGSKKRLLFELRICVCGEKVVVEELVGDLDAFGDNRVFLLFSLAGNFYAGSGRLPCCHSLWSRVFQSELMRLDQPTAREHSPMLTMII